MFWRFTRRNFQRGPKPRARLAVERLEERLTPAGALDTTFGQSGIALSQFGPSSSDEARAVALQADGKIVVAGAGGSSGSAFEVARYNPNGTLDSSFGVGGLVSTAFASGTANGHALAIQSDGKIVVVGSAYMGAATGTDFAIVRYNADGTLDTTFGVGGIVTTDFGAHLTDSAQGVVIQTDGKLVVAGYTDAGSATSDDFALARYNTDGSLDTSFGQGGLATTNFGGASIDEATAVRLQADGGIVVAGISSVNGPFDFALARYSATGSLDATFGQGGLVTTNIGGSYDSATSLVLQADGKIVAAGFASSTSSNFALARYNANGSLDPTFGGTGMVMTDFANGADSAQGLAIQADGKLIAVGYSYPHFSSTPQFALARYNTDGSLDAGFGTNGQVLTVLAGNQDVGEAVALQSDGKIVVAGYAFDANFNGQFAVVRYTGDPVASPPTANAGGPYTVLEGGTVQLDGSQSSDPSQPASTLTYQWDLNGNGIFGETGAAATRGDETGVNPVFSAAGLDGPGTYTVSLKVTDSAGLSSTATATINIVDALPTPAIGGAPATSPEGTAITLTGTASDPSPVDTAAGFTLGWSVTKNGAAFASGTGANFTFTPDDNATYVVSLSATDKDGGVGTTSSTIIVTNVAPTAGLTGPSDGVRGQPRTFTFTASDPSSVDQAAGFTFAVNWGDGTTQTITGPSGTQASHVFTADGSYTVQVTAADQDGSVGPAATQGISVQTIELQGTTLVVGGTPGNDTFVFVRHGRDGVQVILNGTPQGVFYGVNAIVAYGQGGHDSVHVAGSLSVPVTLIEPAGNANPAGAPAARQVHEAALGHVLADWGTARRFAVPSGGWLGDWFGALHHMGELALDAW